VFSFFFIFFSPAALPRLHPSVLWQQPLCSSGAGRVLGRQFSEGMGLQEQKSLHTVRLVSFCPVASALGVLPVPCPDQRRCPSHPSLPLGSALCSCLGPGRAGAKVWAGSEHGHSSGLPLPWSAALGCGGSASGGLQSCLWELATKMATSMAVRPEIR